jgi:hypothetical protein
MRRAAAISGPVEQAAARLFPIIEEGLGIEVRVVTVEVVASDLSR